MGALNNKGGRGPGDWDGSCFAAQSFSRQNHAKPPYYTQAKHTRILVHSIFLHAQREGRVVIFRPHHLHRLSFDPKQFITTSLTSYLLEYRTDHLVDLLDRSPLFHEWHESDYKVGKKVNQANYFIDCEQSLFSQSSLSSAGLERANWPRGTLIIGIIGTADMAKKEVEKTCIFTQKWLDNLLLMTSHLLPQ